MNQQNDNRKVDAQLPIKTYLDCEYSKQPENTARFVLNMVDDSIEGSLGSLVNEPSNLLCFEFPDEYIACGFISIDKRYHLGFYSLNYESDVIVKLDTKNCEYEILVEAVFGFNPAYKITGYTETREGCDTIVYWRDSLNADRYFNLNRIQDFKDDNGNWIVNNFRVNPLITNPVCDFTVQESGGNLELGTYYFVLEFFDRSKSLIYKSLPEGGINIYDDRIELAADGGYNIDSYTEENGGKPATSKSIIINVSNIEMYAYVKLNVIKFTSGDGITRTAHTTTEYQTITGDTTTIYYRGYNTFAGDFEITADELLQRQVIYHDSKVIRSIQGRQVKFNVNEAKRDYSNYQNSASKIKTTFEILPIEYNNVLLDGHPLSPLTPNTFVSERGGEIKAYGICFVHDDFTISPSFHIPGRAKTENDAELGFTRAPSICPEYDANDYEPVVGTATFKIRHYSSEEQVELTMGIIDLEAWHVRVEEIPDMAGFNYNAPGNTMDFESEKVDLGYFYYVTRPKYRTFHISVVVNGITYETIKKVEIDYEADDWFSGFSETILVEELTLTPTSNGNINKIQKWKFSDTSNVKTKLLGYHETCQSVYEDYDCVEDYWGEDWQGNSLSGTPVRHHVIPDRTAIPVTSNPTDNDDPAENSVIQLIGVTFDNIEYPDPTIIGHFFVAGVGEERVVASGISAMYNTKADLQLNGGNDYDDQEDISDYPSGFYVQYARFGNPDRIDHYISKSACQNLITPEYLFKNGYEYPDTIKVHNLYLTDLPDVDDININYFRGSDDFDFLRIYEKRHVALSYYNQYDNTNEEYRIIDNRSIGPRTNFQKYGTTYHNNSHNNKFNLLTLDAQVERMYQGKTEEIVVSSTNANLRYVSLIKYRDSYRTLENIRYRRIHKNILTLNDSQTIYGGDVHISKLDLTNIASANVIPDSTIFDGQEGDVRVEAETIKNLLIESPINMELRHAGTSDCNKYLNGEEISLITLIGNAVSLDSPAGRVPASSICEAYYGYNLDFDLQIRFPLFVFYGISKFYNFCSDCTNRYPTNIIWTDPQSEDNQILREFKPLNYKTLEPHRGEIIDVSYVRDMLLIRTTQSLFFLRSDNQEMQLSGGSIVQLGTGSFFKIFETEVVTSDLGKYGQQGILHSLNSHLGPMWIDQQEGEIYWYGDDIKTISSEGFGHFFQNNLPSLSIKVFPYLDLSDIYMSYDSKFKRVIVHKTDYIPTERFQNDLKNGLIYFDESLKVFRITPLEWFIELDEGEILVKTPNINVEEDIYFVDHVVKGGAKQGIYNPNAPKPIGPIIDYSDKNYFENRSFTLSYSLATQSWRFHSYQPELMFYNAETFFTVLKNTIFKQNYGEGYTNFYGTDFPCIFEYVVKDYFTFNPDGIHFYTKALLENAENKNVTFDKVWIYTNNHSTGIRELLIPTSDFDNVLYPNNLYLIESERDYKIGDIIDYSTIRPITSSEWKDVFNYYFALAQGYIDKVPVNVDFDQNIVNLGQFRDKYIVVRLFFNNHDYRLSLDAIQTIKHYG